MKFILFILLSCLALGQSNNGIRSLNGSLNNSQRLTVDTSASSYSFRWTLSNGVHTLNIPYRIANLSAGGAVGDADSLGGQPASYYAVKADSTIVSAGYGISVSRSLHTSTVTADTSVLIPKSSTSVITSTKYWTNPQYFLSRIYGTSMAVDTLVGRTSTKIVIPDTVFVGVQSTLSNELLNVASNSDADIKAWTASASDVSSLNMFRSRGTIDAPTVITAGDNLAQHRAFGYYSGGFLEVGNMTFLDHGTTNGAIAFKVKHANSAAIVTDTSILALYPFGTSTYGGWLGGKKSTDVPVREWTIAGRSQFRSTLYADSLIDAVRGFSVNGTTVIDNSRNITNAVAITATGTTTFGATGSSQTHKIQSASADMFSLLRPTFSSTAAAGRVMFNGYNTSNAEVTYARINGVVQSSAPSWISGAFQIRTTRAGVDNARLDVDSAGQIRVYSAGVATAISDSIRNLFNIGTISSGAHTATGVSLLDTVRTANLKMTNSGTASTVGNTTLVLGTVTVSTTAVKADSYVILTRKTSGGTIGTSITYTITAGTSFTINSDNVLDTSTFTWMIVRGY